ncbi:RsmB/NOP family class I SAM-dependent RNA methyltransferase [Paracoccus sp. PS-1]|uniref:RsmB/NOP family class I SAM-dependent RNA methyltransferase n=1 Tax=unclassified Paracoccus (in: a-proteobacteria) TaxID=2688777 RepID=UPI00048CEAD7|nr:MULTISPECIES: RsmB/NOP family class I SAM-dependent RNA methyltransferase [unclassified Paracoccus (in: a-proteobacteria)]MDQ7260454.1 RsmB/NOP family class I SAM-dependent RNA methyltransferase [Paracoccus sp. PS1]
MTPAARAAAAIAILDGILAGQAAEAALIRWARASRFAGSGDRAAVRDLVFDALRRRRSRAALGGALSGRGLLLGLCREEGADPATLFTGEGHGPPALSAAELAAGRAPTPAEALDLPDWLLPLWHEALGAAAEPVALAMRDRAPVWLRVNLRRADPARAAAALAEEGIATVAHAELPTALRVSEGARRLSGCRAYREGLVELQDLSPQLACALLPAQGSLLDFCAGGGGKALAMAARGAGPITAHDIDAGRMADLPARAERAGVRIRLAAPGKVAGRFDTVLADVPCSGSGTWRRSPEAKWRLTPEALRRLLSVQGGILDQAAGFVAPGGYLAYMTCSVLSAENQGQAHAFLARNPGFEPVAERRFTPLEASDGFYLALMRRR